MRRRPFGIGGPAVPALGLGTWNFGPSPAARAAALAAIRTGVGLGLVHIDTAEMYGDGRSEKIVGEAIAGLPREELFLVSKVLPSNATFDGTIAACERSLRRLGTDYLDCYLLHWRSPYPLAETIGALERLVDDGKIRSLGVSNFDSEDLDEALGLATRHPVACNQVLFHLGERGIERRLLPQCRTAGVALVGYSPFGSGDFPRDGTPGRAALEGIGAARGLSAHAVALAFLTREDGTFAIPMSADAAHVRANAAAADVVLDAAACAAIDAAFPVPHGDRPLAVI